MKAVRLAPIFPETPNPINWIQNWTESKKVQIAPQESEIESYKVGSFNQDMDDMDLGKFKF